MDHFVKEGESREKIRVTEDDIELKELDASIEAISKYNI